jgi:tetratricopeptide (TPR) repeat protein
MSKSKTTRLTAPGALDDKTINRLIRIMVAVLVVGLPTIGLVYYLDRHVDSGPTIAARTVIAAEEAVRQNPNQLSTRIVLAQAYVADNRSGDAMAQFTIILRSEPANASGLLGRGDLYREAGQLDQAAADYQALIEVAKGGEMAGSDRTLEAAYYGLGSVLYAQHKPRDAATQLANALSVDRTDADALDLMGLSLIAIGDYQNAVSALNDAITYVPVGWCDPYAHLAQAYNGELDGDGVAYANGMVALCQGQLEAAERALLPLLSGAHSGDALVGLGLIAEQRGDAAAAADYYQRVLAVSPDDFAAQTGLGRVGAPATGVPTSAAPTGSTNP